MAMTLSETETVPAKKSPDLWNVYLIEKHSLPDGWQWFTVSARESECPEGFIKIIGAVPSSFTKKTGRPKWGKASKATERTFFLIDAEYKEWVAAWETANDTCSRCFNTGKSFNGFSTDRGTGSVTHFYKPCPCGRPPVGPMEETKETTP